MRGLGETLKGAGFVCPMFLVSRYTFLFQVKCKNIWYAWVCILFYFPFFLLLLLPLLLLLLLGLFEGCSCHKGINPPPSSFKSEGAILLKEKQLFWGLIKWKWDIKQPSTKCAIYFCHYSPRMGPCNWAARQREFMPGVKMWHIFSQITLL